MADLADIVSTIAGSGIGNGFQRAGYDLAGGNALGQETAYTKGASAGLDLVKKRIEARQLRDKAMARDSFMQKYMAANPNASREQVELIDNIIQGEMGSNFNSTMSGLKDQQYMELQRKAAEASDPDVRNAIISAMKGDPLERTRIGGGVAFDPYAAPDAQHMQITPAAAADDVRQALVAGSQVSRNNAAAAKYGAPGQSPIQKRAATLEEDAAIIERDLGRQMTPAERAKYLQTGRFVLTKAEMEEQRKTNIGHDVTDGTDEGKFGSTEARREVTRALSAPATAPAQPKASTSPTTVDNQGVPAGNKVNPAALQKAMDAYAQGKSRAGIAAKLRANGFTAEADAFEAQTK